SDLERAKSFYTSLGFEVNPVFTDENGACIVVEENVFFMLLTREFFGTFTEKTLPDTKTNTTVLTALSCDSRSAVDRMLATGLANGGREPVPPQDHGFMYGRDLEDPDGNVLEFFYMDPAAVESGPEALMAGGGGGNGNGNGNANANERVDPAERAGEESFLERAGEDENLADRVGEDVTMVDEADDDGFRTDEDGE